MKKHFILVVEYSNLAAMAIKEMLDRKGFRVNRASDGRAALEKYQAQTSEYYDLILMNTWLPKISSRELTRIIRREEARPQADSRHSKCTPIIGIFSNKPHPKQCHYQKYYQAGMNDLFPFPLTERNLDKIMEKYL